MALRVNVDPLNGLPFVEVECDNRSGSYCSEILSWDELERLIQDLQDIYTIRPA